jgi:hypothetical protein
MKIFYAIGSTKSIHLFYGFQAYSISDPHIYPYPHPPPYTQPSALIEFKKLSLLLRFSRHKDIPLIFVPNHLYSEPHLLQ